MARMSRAALGVVLVLAAWAASAPAHAQDIFRITGVRAQAEAATAAAAQEPALGQGYAIALERLTERLVGRRERVLAPPVTPAIASDLVAGHEVVEQANTATTYIATINVTFDPQRVREYFGAIGVQHVESRTRAMLVVPVWREAGGVRLWRNNPWLASWQERSFIDELTPILTPLANIEDISSTPAVSAARRDRATLAGLARRYDLKRVLVVEARGAPTAGFSAQAWELDFDEGGAAVSRGAASGRTLAEVRDLIFLRMQEDWKQSLSATAGVQSSIVLSVEFDSHEEWRVLEDGVGGAALLSNVQLEALTRDGAMLRARFRGALEQLQLELRERGVALTPLPPSDFGETLWRVETLERANRRRATQTPPRGNTFRTPSPLPANGVAAPFPRGDSGAP